MKPEADLDPSNKSVEATLPPATRPETGAESDRALVERARAGDAEAFRALVVGHQDRAYALALRILQSAPDAEEAAQDAFVRVWRALGSFRGDSAFSTWLHSIVTRAALDRARTLRSRRDREVALEEPDALAGRDPAPPADDARRAERAQMERLLGKLPALQRAAVTLYYYEDRSVERVAEALGLPIGTVKTHLSRARTALRRMWTREEALQSP